MPPPFLLVPGPLRQSRDAPQGEPLGSPESPSPGGCMTSRSLPSGRADRGDLLRDVDGDGAPGDAPAAADATRAAELVVPGSELVREPLAVARLCRLPDAAAVDVRVVDREAGVPDAVALGAAVQVVRVLDRGAEAGRAGHRAVAAGQAALGDLVPPRMLEVLDQQVADVASVERPAHP